MRFVDKQWRIKDGVIPDAALKIIREQKGDFDLVFKRHEVQRTNAQNRSLHLYYEHLAKALNDGGFDMRAVISEGVDIPWSDYTVKEHLWRPTQKALLGKVSTKQLRKLEDINRIYDVINKTVGERTGIFVPFPSREE